jgi:uncharacterized cupin superfamily protein
MSTSHILNIKDVEFSKWGHGERFEAQLGAIGPRVGAKKLGYKLVVLPPGKCGWPAHFHHVNEEMFFIIEGTGSLRYGAERHPLKPGDVVCCPAGAGVPHQISNNSDGELRYLAVSTMDLPEVVEYPDSGKFGVVHGPPGALRGQWSFSFFGRGSSATDYWDGEK